MATRIRLRRVGRKKQPSYRIVVIEKEKARDGSFVESLGHYNPRTEPTTLEVDREKARGWLAKGATPSDTVRSLLKKVGVYETSIEAAAEEAAAAPVGVVVEAPAEESAEEPAKASAGESVEASAGEPSEASDQTKQES